jgi:hypothetical protein
MLLAVSDMLAKPQGIGSRYPVVEDTCSGIPVVR